MPSMSADYEFGRPLIAKMPRTASLACCVAACRPVVRCRLGAVVENWQGLSEQLAPLYSKGRLAFVERKTNEKNTPVSYDLQIRMSLENKSNRAELMQLLSDFEVYEETHLIGASDIVAYVKAAAGPLAGFLNILKLRQDKQMVGRLKIQAGSDRAIEIERFQIDNADDIAALAENLLAQIQDDKPT